MTVHLVPTAPPPPAPDRLRIGAWVLYDLANTVYAATVTFLFTPFAKDLLGGDLRPIGVVQLTSMALAALLVPAAGAFADQTARTRRYLVAVTLACITCMAGFAVDAGDSFGTVALLACFFVANVTYNLGLLFYNTLLPAVAPPGREGRVSGLGTGFGYVGTILVVALLLPDSVTERTPFLVAAAMFLLFALPCLLLVRDPRPLRTGRGAGRAALRQLAASLRELPANRPLAWFLLGNFCLVDVLNTAILYFAEFTTTVFAASAAAGTLTLFGQALGDATLLKIAGLGLNGLALVFGIAQGPWSDRAPLAVMRVSALALAGALAGGALFGGHSALGYLLTLVVLGAFGLAGIQTAGRKVVVLLAPPERRGEYFGLYGVTLKLSAVGGAVYGFVSHGHGVKAAMLVQGVPLLLGVLCLAMVRLPRSGGATAST